MQQNLQNNKTYPLPKKVGDFFVKKTPQLMDKPWCLVVLFVFLLNFALKTTIILKGNDRQKCAYMTYGQMC